MYYHAPLSYMKNIIKQHDMYHKTLQLVGPTFVLSKRRLIMSNTESNNTGHTGKVIGALLVGTVVGAGLALLFAPDSGSETQKKLMNELKNVFGGIKDKVKSHQCPECAHKQEEEPAKQA
jgi:hypothetical protein